jgi:hypothetical protein
MAITTLEQLVAKLSKEGIFHVVIPRDNGGVILEAGRFGYLVDKHGKIGGGYVLHCADDCRDWLEWGAILGTRVALGWKVPSKKRSSSQ